MTTPHFTLNILPSPGSFITGGAVPTYSLASGPPRSGLHSDTMVANASGGTTFMGRTFAGTPVTAGVPLMFSGWVKAAATGRSAQWYATWRNGGGTQVGVQQTTPATATSASAWTEVAGTLTPPIGAVTADIHIAVSGSFAASETLWFDDMVVSDISVGTVSDVLRLEVETDPPAGAVANLVQNPSSELGGWNWVTPIAGSVMLGLNDRGYTGYRTALEYRAAGGVANYFASEFVPVTPGQYVGASWVSPYCANYYRQRIEFFNSSTVLLSSSTQTGYLQSSSTRQHAAPFLVPASAAYARVRFDQYSSSAGANPSAGSKMSLYDVMLGKAPTAAPVTSLPYAEPVYWSSILGPTHEIGISREELNVGTLTATVLDAMLDPAVADEIRPGKRCRLTALNPETRQFEPLFTGKVDNAKVAYDLKTRLATDPKHARIELTATDNITALAGTARAEGVNEVSQLPYLLEGAGVPWVCDDVSGQVDSGSVDIVALNENASLLDQIAITRDTWNGYAWVDRRNVLRAYSPYKMPQGENLIANGDFEANASAPMGWTGTNCALAVSTGNAYEGANCLRMAATAAGGMVARIANNVLPVRPGSTYRIWARMRAGATGRNVYASCHWYDAAGAFISTEASGIGDDSGLWGSWSNDCVAPANAAYMQVFLIVLAAAAGEVHYWDDVRVEGPTTVIDETAYSDIGVDFDTDRCINEVSVKWLRYNAATGETTEIPYGPFRDQPSIDEWGLHHKDFTIQGPSDDVPSAQSLATNVFYANGTPTIRINSARLPIVDEGGLQYAHLDLYDLVPLSNAAKGLNSSARITGIKQTITPNSWIVDLEFASQGGVAMPQATPGVALTVPTGWVNLPPVSGFASTGAQVRRIGSVVRFRGLITGNVPVATTTQIATVPVGFRPGAANNFNPVLTSGGFVGWSNVSQAGVMSVHIKAPYAGGSAVADLTAISYTTD